MASSSDQAPPSPGFKIILKRTADGRFSGRVVKISEPPVSKKESPLLPSCVAAAKVLKRRRPPCLDQDDEAAFEAKLEATARKLHDRYEQHEQAKRKRSVQVVNYLPEQQPFRAKKLPGKPKSCLQKRVVVGNKGLPISSSRLVRV